MSSEPDDRSGAAQAPIPEIDIDRFAELRNSGRPVLDVRELDEYIDAHVPGAILVPLSELPDRVQDVPPGDLLIICKSGGRSMRAAAFLADRGWACTNVAGGTSAWIAAGRAVATGPDRG